MGDINSFEEFLMVFNLRVELLNGFEFNGGHFAHGACHARPNGVTSDGIGIQVGASTTTILTVLAYRWNLG